MLLTTSELKQREVPATVSSFYVSVLYTAKLRTSIAAVVFGCVDFCPLDCDIATSGKATDMIAGILYYVHFLVCLAHVHNDMSC